MRNEDIICGISTAKKAVRIRRKMTMDMAMAVRCLALGVCFVFFSQLYSTIRWIGCRTKAMASPQRNGCRAVKILEKKDAMVSHLENRNQMHRISAPLTV